MEWIAVHGIYFSNFNYGCDNSTNDEKERSPKSPKRRSRGLHTSTCIDDGRRCVLTCVGGWMRGGGCMDLWKEEKTVVVLYLYIRWISWEESKGGWKRLLNCE